MCSKPPEAPLGPSASYPEALACGFDAVFSKGWADALTGTLREIFHVGGTNARDLCVGMERRQRLEVSVGRAFL